MRELSDLMKWTKLTVEQKLAIYNVFINYAKSAKLKEGEDYIISKDNSKFLDLKFDLADVDDTTHYELYNIIVDISK